MSYLFTNPSDAARTKNKWGMGYYVGDRFPYPQDTGGPFQAFPGTPRLANPPFPIPAPMPVCPPSAMSTKKRGLRKGLRYYVGDRFPYPQDTGGPFQAFPGMPGLANPPFPVAPAMVITPAAPVSSSASKSLSMFRPNQAVAGGIYGLGDPDDDTTEILSANTELNVPVLVGGAALLFAAAFLFGKQRGGVRRRRS